MSIATFIAHGASGDNRRLCRSRYPEEKASLYATSNRYEGKVVCHYVEGSTEEEHIIDGAIKVQTVATVVKEEAIEFWSEAKRGSTITFAATLAVGVVAAGAAIAVGILLPHLWIVAIAIAAVALLSFGVFGFSLHKSFEAERELAPWEQEGGHNSAVERMKEKRQQVGREGFNAAMRNNLKGEVVTAEEVTQLWREEVDRKREAFDGKELSEERKVDLVNSFIDSSPFSLHATSYAFGEEIDPALTTFTSRFAAIEKKQREVREGAANLRSGVSRIKGEELRKNDRHRDTLLRPYRELIAPKKSCLERQQRELSCSIATKKNSLAGIERNRAFQQERENTARRERVESYLLQKAALEGRIRELELPIGAPIHHRRNIDRRLAAAHEIALRQNRTLSTPVATATANNTMDLLRIRGELDLLNTVARRENRLAYTPIVIPASEEELQLRSEIESDERERRQVERDLADLETIFREMTQPIQTLHENNRLTIERWADSEKAKIQSRQDRETLPFFAPIKELLTDYKNNQSCAAAAPLEELVIEESTSVAPPKLETKYKQAEYSGKWRNIIEEYDWKRKQADLVHDQIVPSSMAG